MSNNNNDVLIACEGVSKKFCRDFKRSLWYGIKDVSLSFSDRGDHNSVLRKDEFWAVKDISFELRRGECIGLIGHNGAGKSTLLKILNGLLTPDVGQVTMRGRVGALIELGAGFNPILTGRENVYNNAAVLGFTKAEIDAKYDAIVAFSEIGEFIESPVQNYSSGMKVRLGFAIAAEMEPDILLIDEVLAVGDLGFKLKCFKTIDEILPHTAIIFVSHSMPMVSRICNKIILMDKGMAKNQGKDISGAIDQYYGCFADNDQNIVFSDGSLSLENSNINALSFTNEGLSQISWGDDFNLKLKFKLHNCEEIPVIDVIIFDKEQRPVGILETSELEDIAILERKTFEISIQHKKIQLSKGVYSINLVVKNKKGTPKLRINSILAFQVTHDKDIWQPFLLESEHNVKY